VKKEKQIGVRVGLPAFFALEVEDVYRHTSGAHRTLAFPDFLGFLIGLGLKEYRKGTAPEPEQKEAPDIEDKPKELPEEEGREAALCLFDLAPGSLPDLFREFEEDMGPPPPVRSLRLVRSGKNVEEA
jgi:hypothetical protein